MVSPTGTVIAGWPRDVEDAQERAEAAAVVGDAGLRAQAVDLDRQSCEGRREEHGIVRPVAQHGVRERAQRRKRRVAIGFRDLRAVDQPSRATPARARSGRAAGRAPARPAGRSAACPMRRRSPKRLGSARRPSPVPARARRGRARRVRPRRARPPRAARRRPARRAALRAPHAATSRPGGRSAAAANRSVPAIASSATAASRTVPAIGPNTAGLSCAGSVEAGSGTARGRALGLSPTTPQHAAGIRIEPPMSLPSHSGTNPAATAAALPPEEPPADSRGSRGLRVGPWRTGSVTGRSPSSGVFVLPTTIAPAARSRAHVRGVVVRDPVAEGGAAVGHRQALGRREQVLDPDRHAAQRPRVAGPDRGRPPPAPARRRSATNASISPSSRSIARSDSSTTSRADTSPERTRAATAVGGHLHVRSFSDREDLRTLVDQAAAGAGAAA